MADIATACGRADLFAAYDDPDSGYRLLPVVGWDSNGRALVQKPNGDTGHARRVHVKRYGHRLPFVCIDSFPDGGR